MIENQPNEITFIFHSDKPEDQKARGYVEGLVEYHIKTIDLKRETITETQLAEIANKMGKEIKEIVDPLYADRVSVSSLDDLDAADLLNLAVHEAIVINTPILIVGKDAFQYATGYAFIQKGAATTGTGNNPVANVEERQN